MAGITMPKTPSKTSSNVSMGTKPVLPKKGGAKTSAGSKPFGKR
jgi:hypothetical protein